MATFTRDGRKSRRTSLRLRIILVAVCVVTLHVFTDIALLAREARDSIRQEQSDKGAWIVRSLSEALSNALIVNDFATVRSTVDMLFANNQFFRLAVFDEAKRAIVDRQADARHDTHVPAWFVSFLDLDLMPVTHRFEVGGVHYGDLLALVSPENTIEKVWRQSRIKVAAGVMEIAIAWLLLEFFLRLGMRPLKELSQTVQRIGNGDFTARMSLSSTSEFQGLITTVNTMAEEMSSLLDKTRKQAASEAQARRLHNFHAITASLDDTNTKIQALLQMGRSELALDAGIVGEVRGKEYVVSHVTPESNRLKPGDVFALHDTFSGLAIRHQGIFSIHHVAQSEWADNTGHVSLGIQSFIGAPIYVEGRIIGTINFIGYTPRAESFHPSETELVKLMAQWLGLAIERDKHERALWQEKEQVQVTLASIADGVITTDTSGRVTFMNSVAENLTGWKQSNALGRPLKEIYKLAQDGVVQQGESTALICMRENRIIEVGADTTLVSLENSEYAIENKAAPIRDRDQHILGAVVVFRDVTQTRNLTRQLEHFASHDQLTGLPNRRFFETALERVLASAQKGHKTHAVCYLDLDQFKIVNDTCGHIAGDDLLRRLSALLQTRLRGTDVLARLGGDEFGLILGHVTEEQAMAVAQEMRQLVREFRFRWDGKMFEIGVSVGLILIDSSSGSIADVMSQADIACYVAKNLGRNRVHLYKASDAENTRVSNEMGWVQRLREAIRGERFKLWYQSIMPIGVSDPAMRYGEILLRLHEPDDKIILPGVFTPAAERYGLMPEIDRWVIRKTIEHIKNKLQTGIQLRCAVNLSGTSLGDPDMLQFIREELQRSQVPPLHLCFEVTETAAVSNLAQATQLINELRKLGCTFALDDFGTGLSSFSYLKHLPVDFLKIDGSFVKKMVDDPLDDAMVQSINQIGHVMGKKTIAEFVENDAIMERLKVLGVDYAQGFGIAKPQPLI